VQQTADRPAGRYGDRSRRPAPALVAAAVVVATAFVGWVVWAALGAAAPGPRGEVTAFRVVSDDQIDVRVRAEGGDTARVGCSIRALDRTREVVGVAGVWLRPGTADRGEKWVSVRTRDRAVTATVTRCLEDG
jgi:Domain of unknown function (DUF4307)